METESVVPSRRDELGEPRASAANTRAALGDGFAIFTHNVISLSDDWKLTLGLRYIDEEKDGEGVLNGVAPLPEDASANDVFLATAAGNEPPCLNPVFRAALRSFCDNASWTRKRSDDAITGTVSLGYAINDNQNVYVSYSRGFKAGGLNFHSSSYDWLVVTGSDYAKFKGSGTVNGELAPNAEEYKFMLWAGDKDPDTFRIKIWWEDGETEYLVYDNGADQPIGGGNIVVHTK